MLYSKVNLPEVTLGDARPDQPFRIHAIDRRLGAETVRKLIERYRAGAILIDLAEEQGVSKTALADLFRRHDVPLRRRAIDDLTAKNAETLYATGLSLAALSERMGLPRKSLRRALLDRGVRLRPRGGS